VDTRRKQLTVTGRVPSGSITGDYLLSNSLEAVRVGAVHKLAVDPAAMPTLDYHYDNNRDSVARGLAAKLGPARPAQLPNNVRRNNLLAADAASFSPMRLNSLSRSTAEPSQQAAAITPVRLSNNVRRNNLLTTNASNFEARLNSPIRPITGAAQSPVAASPSPRQVDPGITATPRGGLSSPDVAYSAALNLRQLGDRALSYNYDRRPGPYTVADNSMARQSTTGGGVAAAPSMANVSRSGRQLPPMSAVGTTPTLTTPPTRSRGQQQYASTTAPRARGIAPRLDPQNARYAAGAGTLADTLAAKRVNGEGVWADTPTPEAQQEYAAAVQARRAANPDPRLRFLRNESGFRPGAGRTAVADRLRQQYLRNPMTGGRSGDMRDRFARLDAIDPPGRAKQESDAVAANQKSYRAARDAAINAQLQQSGYNETKLREEALARRQPRMEFGGFDAASLLAPRTRVTWEHGGKQHSMLTGPGRAPRTPEDEARSAYSRGRDVDAVRERLARARAARLAMRGQS
jgi:hypothetical protein